MTQQIATDAFKGAFGDGSQLVSLSVSLYICVGAVANVGVR